MFHTSSTQPTTYTLLRSYLLHRLHTSGTPKDDNTSISQPISKFPFPYRANVLDRDAVMVPSGWDTWGKINVLRDGFDPSSICEALEASLDKSSEGQGGQDLEGMWSRMIPDPHRIKVSFSIL